MLRKNIKIITTYITVFRIVYDNVARIEAADY